MGLMTTITHWWFTRRARQELASLNSDELRRLAQDVGLGQDQLTRLMARGARAGEELSRFLRSIGLVPERLERTHPDTMRDMNIVCSGCGAARRCRRDLDRGWTPVVQRYCPNTDTIEAMRAERCRVVP